MIPKPEPTDRATTAALLAAFSSDAVRARHEQWRVAADALAREIERMIWNREQDQDPYVEISPAKVKPLRMTVRPTEVAARVALADLVGHELGHRR